MKLLPFLSIGRMLIMLLAVLAETSLGDIYYVSSISGNDAGDNPDNSSSPFASIQYAVNAADFGGEIRIATYEVSPGFPPTTNTCVYTGNVTTVTNIISMISGGGNTNWHLKGGYIYDTSLDTWVRGVVPALVDGQNSYRGLYIQGESGQTNTIELLEFANGSATNGANIYAKGGSSIFVGTPIHDGTALEKGGGMYLKGIDLSMSIGAYSNISLPQLSGMLPVYNNSALEGGGIYIESGMPVLSTLGIYANDASGAGGGVYIEGGYPSIIGGIVQENSAVEKGGGFYMKNSISRVGGMNIFSNRAACGGGAYIDGPFSFSMEAATLIANNYIRHNIATNEGGGGLYLKEANIGIVNNVIANNMASTGAAAMLCGSSPQFYQNTFADNQGDSGIYVTHVPVTGRWVVVETWLGTYSNWVDGIPVPSWVVMTNTIISGHETALIVKSSGHSILKNSVDMGYTLWWSNSLDSAGAGGFTHHHDLYSDPLYTCTEMPPDCVQPYHLETNSPAIDTGTVVSLTLPGSDLLLDIDGQMRPAGEGMDLGADEVVPLNSHSVWFVPAGYSQTVHPGDVFTNEHYLLNSGDLPDTYTIHSSNALPAWNSAATPTSVVMAAQTYTTITVVVTVPAGASNGETNLTTVVATSINDSDQTATAVEDSTVITNAFETKTRFVWQNSPNPQYPYTDRITAGHDIQTVVDASHDGDTVLVAEGCYDSGGAAVPRVPFSLTNRVCLTNTITLRSENGPLNTYICGSAGSGAGTFDKIRCVYVTSDASVCGFKLLNGETLEIGDTMPRSGGGVFIQTGGTVSNCFISGCFAGYGGGGAYCDNGGIVVNSAISANKTYGNGGGVVCNQGGTIINSTVSDNQSSESEADGGGGIYCNSGGAIRNCIIYYNTSVSGGDNWHCDSGGVLEFCCTMPTNGLGTGCITNTPMFINRAEGDYRLKYGSVCIDSGTNLSESVTNDLYGTTRPLDGDWNGTNDFDMGCFEYNPDTADSNGDEVPDWWYHQYNLNPTATTSGSADNDDDGVPNNAEYAADTIPTNDLSFFRLLNIEQTNSFAIEFSCTNTRVYSLESKDSLVTGEWVFVAGATNAHGHTDGRMNLIDSEHVPKRTYRVNVSLP